ncbi:Guanylate cyclase soluble subunit beta-2 [Collichthys lucidus]|uniref:guanylate cyclase n=1 Tax=Collichthys lucidus TaxID=240159 RepID=A0A4U5V080_COLLU|nr:Guanylate cyclase soluble subunit beta-2 [Collichthys lucidus]
MCRDEAGVQDTFLTYEVYKDEITMQLVAEACKLLGVKPEVVLKQFGEYFFEFCKRSGYDHMLRTLGGNLFEFTENLDALHSYLTLSYKEMNAPSFRVEKNTDGTMLLHYYSDRRGLCHIVPGIIGAVAKDFFNSEITMEIVSQLEELERTGKKEHVVFLVTQWPAVDTRSSKTQSLEPLSNRSNANIIWIKETMSIHLDLYFSIVHPEVTFTISSIRKFINSHFVLQTRRDMMPETWRDRPMLQLREVFKSWRRGKCTFPDIAPHDVTRDLILLNQQRLAEMELSNQLERKKEELRLLSQHLEEERRKTENLLYAMLPKHVANQLKEGKTVEAGEFKECTILFSDVVTFTNICSLCEPIQIVLMLNSMYLRFDRLTTVHNVYKIRVGLHSGPVLAGVVGEKMPRYCLFGDTVNTASRMESHGLPDKIHLSPDVYQALKNKCYVIQKRGEIEVKGKGRMTTYFLERNFGVSEQRIMGVSDLEAGAGQQDSQMSNQPGVYRLALQRQRRDDLCLIPMKYGDSLSEPPSSSHMSEPQTCPTIKPRDSESYGSLHTDDQSEGGALDQLNDGGEFGQTEVKHTEEHIDGIESDHNVDTREQHLITGAVVTNNQNKHTRTRLCVVL